MKRQAAIGKARDVAHVTLAVRHSSCAGQNRDITSGHEINARQTLPPQSASLCSILSPPPFSSSKKKAWKGKASDGGERPPPKKDSPTQFRSPRGESSSARPDHSGNQTTRGGGVSSGKSSDVNEHAGRALCPHNRWHKHVTTFRAYQQLPQKSTRVYTRTVDLGALEERESDNLRAGTASLFITTSGSPERHRLFLRTPRGLAARLGNSLRDGAVAR